MATKCTLLEHATIGCGAAIDYRIVALQQDGQLAHFPKLAIATIFVCTDKLARTVKMQLLAQRFELLRTQLGVVADDT